MMEPLREPDHSARVYLQFGALTWPNDFDIAPEWLRREMESRSRTDAGGGGVARRRRERTAEAKRLAAVQILPPIGVRAGHSYKSWINSRVSLDHRGEGPSISFTTRLYTGLCVLGLTRYLLYRAEVPFRLHAGARDVACTLVFPCAMNQPYPGVIHLEALLE